ncbi:MAG TPA: VOC family protein [Ilumatobacteraceae bacterium]|nr:VOC family protein [Ilumatobacteraceae bacterium]
MSLHPYLFFTNTTREAMTRYQEILGGQLDIMNVADLPPGESMGDDVPDTAVAHAALTLGEHDMLMASDDPSGDGTGVKGASIHLGVADAAEARRIFDALADGGRIEMELEPTFWSPLFGSCVDRFGVSWMIDVATDQTPGS